MSSVLATLVWPSHSWATIPPVLWGLRLFPVPQLGGKLVDLVALRAAFDGYVIPNLILLLHLPRPSQWF